MDYQKTFSKNLKFYRQQRNLTQKQLAETLNKKESTVRMWELGKTQPTLTTIIKLSIVLGVSLDRLVGLESGGNDSWTAD